MTTQDRGALRALIVPAGLSPADSRAGRLLRDLGHDVAGAESPDQALELLRESDTDLMVVDVTNSEQNQALLRRMADLPRQAQPRTLAVFADSSNETLRETLRCIGAPRTHILLKPLHFHKLLEVVRRLELDTMASA